MLTIHRLQNSKLRVVIMLDADYLVNDPTQLVASLFLTGHRASMVLDLLSRRLWGSLIEYTVEGSNAIRVIRDKTDRLCRLLSTLMTVFEREEVLTHITSSSIQSYSTLLTPIAQLICYLDTWEASYVERILTEISSSSWRLSGSYMRITKLSVGSAFELMERNGMAYLDVWHYLETVTR